MLKAVARPRVAGRLASIVRHGRCRNYSSTVEFGRQSSVGLMTSRNLCKVNEDTYIVAEVDVGGGKTGLLAAVFDGHGGVEASQYCAKTYLAHLHAALRSHPSVEEAVAAAIATEETDVECHLKKDERLKLVGTTATIAVLNGRKLTVANVGDSPAFIYSTSGDARQVTHDHKAADAAEQARVKAAGGEVFAMYGIPRLQGVLAVTRALGDLALRSHGLISTPSVLAHDVTENDAFLLVCSDGLVDGMSPDNAYKIAKASKTPQEAVRRMVTASEMGPGSRDSITAVLVPLLGWDTMRANVEESEIYKYLLSVRSDGFDAHQEELFRFMLMLEAYLPSAITVEELTKQMTDFISTGTGDFGDIAFKVFDADCDGELDYYEIESLLKMIGAPYKDGQIANMFALADIDHNGTISLQEFRQAIRILLHYLTTH